MIFELYFCFLGLIFRCVYIYIYIYAKAPYPDQRLGCFEQQFSVQLAVQTSPGTLDEDPNRFYGKMLSGRPHGSRHHVLLYMSRPENTNAKAVLEQIYEGFE